MLTFRGKQETLESMGIYGDLWESAGIGEENFTGLAAELSLHGRCHPGEMLTAQRDGWVWVRHGNPTPIYILS